MKPNRNLVLCLFLQLQISSSTRISRYRNELVTPREDHPSKNQLIGAPLLGVHTPSKLHKRSVKPRAPIVSTSCTCGLKPAEKSRIIGGQLSRDNAWPWVAAVVYVGQSKPAQFCGATLINSQYVLTAQHCLLDVNKENLNKLQIYLGTNSISNSINATKLNIVEMKPHPNFKNRTLENDIALLKLSQPVIYTPQIYPVCLQTVGAPYVGIGGTVAGWGSIKKGGKGVDKLREVKVRIMNNMQCAKNYSTVKMKVTGTMMCAGLPSKDACQGDSGGSLFLRNLKEQVFSQVGVVSFGFDCGRPAFPGVYTRVSSYIKWIQANTQDAIYCQKSF